MKNLNAFEMGVADHLEIELVQRPGRGSSAILFDDGKGSFPETVADKIRSGGLDPEKLSQDIAKTQVGYGIRDLRVFFSRCLGE